MESLRNPKTRVLSFTRVLAKLSCVSNFWFWSLGISFSLVIFLTILITDPLFWFWIYFVNWSIFWCLVQNLLDSQVGILRSLESGICGHNFSCYSYEGSGTLTDRIGFSTDPHGATASTESSELSTHKNVPYCSF